MRSSRALGALKYRNFRFFWFGQVISLIGYWMQVTALSWLVWRLTRSGTVLGAVAFAANLPVLLLGYYSGLLVDRCDRRRLVFWAQVVDMALAFVAAWLTYTGSIRVWHIVGLSMLGGLNHTIEIPARQTFFMDMVGRDDLMSAIALNSAAFNVSRVIGPTIAGLCLGTITEAGCFFVNGVSFLALIGALAAMDFPSTRATNPPHVQTGPWAGLRYIGQHSEMRTLLATIAVTNLLIAPFTTHLLPVFIDQILGRKADALGLYIASFGFGALTGGFVTASRERSALSPRLAMRGLVGFSLAILCLSFAPGFWAGLVLLMITGYMMITQTSTTNNYLQSHAPDGLRGRIVAAYTTTFVGLLPIGCLILGRACDLIGIRSTMRIGSVTCLVWALVRHQGLPEESAQDPDEPPSPSEVQTPPESSLEIP